MDVVKKILAGLVIAISIIGIGVCLVGIFYSWSLNTPVTNAIEGALTGVEKFLTITDEGLSTVSDGLGEAGTAVTTVEDAFVEAGEIINETNLAYELVDRTVGDTLFPKIEHVAGVASTVTSTVVAFNETLEAANKIPFVEVPTLTTKLEEFSTKITQIQSEVQATRDELQTIKEEKVAKPVNAITDRTTRISSGLAEVEAAIGVVQSDIDASLAEVGVVKSEVARTIDLISIAVTIVLLWIILAQGALILFGFELFKGENPFKLLTAGDEKVAAE